MFGAKKREEIVHENTHVLVTTTESPRDFEVVECICEFASATAEMGGGIRMQEAFRLLQNKLRQIALNLGGDAIVDCQFSHRFAHSGGLAAAQVLELWAFGTVVKFKDTNAAN